jgi:hypothetical protein
MHIRCLDSLVIGDIHDKYLSSVVPSSGVRTEEELFPGFESAMLREASGGGSRPCSQWCS